MTAPRRILPGTTYLITRRCTQRQFLLAPREITNQIFWYVLARAVERHGMLLHSACVLSNHFHLVVTDPDARLPAFSQYLASLVARAMNAALGRWESFWSPGSYSAVALTTIDDVVEKCAYTLANPVAAGLVAHAGAWTGVWSDPASIGGAPIAFERPEKFFSKKGSMPATATLRFVPPPGVEAGEFRARVEEALASHEARARATNRAPKKASPPEGGARAATTSRPATREPRRGLNPRVAARDTALRISALERLKEFRAAYREARERFRAGARDVLFPSGTYLLRVTQGVRCAAPC